MSLRVLLFLLLVLSAACARADVVNPLPYDLVYVRAPYFGADYNAALPNDGNSVWPDTVRPLTPDAGATLMRLRSDGQRELLFPREEHRALLDTPAGKPLGVGSVSDPNVSFDGRRVVFAWYHDLSPEARNGQRGGLSRAGADLYEIDVATRALRRLTQQEFTPNTGNGANFAAGNNHPQIGVFNTGPTYAPRGRIVFTSSRNNLLPPKQASAGQRVLQLFAMDGDGANVEQIGHLNLGMALHPQVLRDGRILFSSWEMQGLRDVRAFALWLIDADGRNWNSVSGYADHPFVHHFATQMPDGDLVVTRYYNLNNNGFGSLLRYPLDPPGVDFLSDDPDPASGVAPHERRDPSQPGSLRRDITPFTTHLDYPAPCPGFERDPTGSAFAPYPCAPAQRRGKFTHPQATPAVPGRGGAAAELLAVYAPGGANHRSLGAGNPGLPWYHGEIVLLPDGENVPVPAACANGPAAGCTAELPTPVVRVLAEDGYNLQWPRPLVPFAQLYGVAEPAGPPPLGDAQIQSEGLVPGEPFGLIGSSSLIWRDTRPARSRVFADRDPFNPFSWDFSYSWVVQGTDAGLYADDDIYALRVLLQEPLGDLSYPDNSPQHQTHGRERLRILGEVPVRGPLSGKPGTPLTALPDGRVVADTSFLVRVPADASVMFQSIDRRGLALNTAQTWHQVRPGEARYDCGGCHSHSKESVDFSTTAAAQPGYARRDFALATPLLARGGSGGDALETRPARSVSLEYFRDIVPILDTRCAGCHGATNPAGPGPGLRLASSAPPVQGWPAAYHALALAGTDPVSGAVYTRLLGDQAVQPTRYVRALQARQSLLLWAVWNERLDGRANATRNDDIDFAGHPAIAGLTDAERFTLARWVDTGAGIELRGRADPTDTPSQQNLWGYDDDDLRPTLVLRPSAEAAETAGYIDAVDVAAFDIESGLRSAAGAWTLSADRAIGSIAAGANLAAGVALPDNGTVRRVTLPVRVAAPTVFTLRVRDSAGNLAEIRRRYRFDRVFADGFQAPAAGSPDAREHARATGPARSEPTAANGSQRVSSLFRDCRPVLDSSDEADAFPCRLLVEKNTFTINLYIQRNYSVPIELDRSHDRTVRAMPEERMNRLILSMMMTLDGFVAGPGNELDWVVWEEEMDRDAAQLIESVDTMLVGYGAYRDMAAYWPGALTTPGSPGEGHFARLINDKPKIILSRNHDKLLWKNDELLAADDLAGQVAQLKKDRGDIVFYGGAGVARSMVAAGVVDEYRLLVSPAAIGQGKPLFSALPARLGLHATVTKVYESGAILLNYRVRA